MIKHDEYTESNSLGVLHPENQDSLLIDEEHLVFAVADGVGGYQGAKLASEIAVRTLEERMKTIRKEEDLSMCLEEMHSEMLAKSRELGYPFMGTTVALCKVLEDEKKILSANVGDSPIYLVRSGAATSLYHDDSERSENPKNTWSLTQYLGFGPQNIKPRSRMSAFMEGDILLLCSDGVSDNILSQDGNLDAISKLVTEKSAKELVEKAMSIGAKRDDMSAILVFF